MSCDQRKLVVDEGGNACFRTIVDLLLAYLCVLVLPRTRAKFTRISSQYFERFSLFEPVAVVIVVLSMFYYPHPPQF
jgi:hypothetical protein